MGLSSCALLSQCSDPPIHYVIPDGYTGAFQIVLDEVKGVDIKLENGSYTYNIPKAGQLRVKSFQPFYGCHKEIARYTNGTQLPTDDHNTVKSDTVALRVLGTTSTNDGPLTMTNVIGTQKEAEEAQRELIKGKPREPNPPVNKK
jgi:hypothetical protein